MKDFALEKLSVKELRELLLMVDHVIASRRNDERNALREQFRAMAEEAGFTLNEIVGGGRGKGRAAAAKYANPDNPSETWSGRGRQPKWLSSKVKAGAKLEDFLIT